MRNRPPCKKLGFAARLDKAVRIVQRRCSVASAQAFAERAEYVIKVIVVQTQRLFLKALDSRFLGNYNFARAVYGRSQRA